MSAAKVVGLVVLGLLLFGVVGAANAVTTAERTVLDGEYVNERIESEGGAETIRNVTVEAITARMETADLSEGQQLLRAGESTDNRSLVADAVTEEYIENQTSANVLALYDYLHGRESSVGMEIDLRELKTNLADSFADQIQKKDTSTLIEEFGPAESEMPVPIDGTRLEQMRSSPEGYEQARLEFRVDLGFELTSNDQKLLLIGEDPRQYSESEKEQLVENREQEIRNAIAQELEDNTSELSSRVSEETQQRRADAKDRICAATVSELNPDSGQQICSDAYEDSGETTGLDNVTRAAVELQYVVVDGLTREKARYGHAEFDSDLTAAEDHLSTETADLARNRIEQEVPDTLSAQEQFGEDATTQLENAQTTVGTIDSAYTLLPIAALVLVALAFLLTRSLQTTATFTGIVLTIVGGLYFVGATVFGGTVVTAVETGMENNEVTEFSDFAVSIVEGVLSTLGTQSGILLAVGIVLIVLSFLSKSRQSGSAGEV